VNSVAKMDEFCKENMFSAWYETSAKENVNIDDAAKTLVSQVPVHKQYFRNTLFYTRFYFYLAVFFLNFHKRRLPRFDIRAFI
jgi:hypothetical protein